MMGKSGDRKVYLFRMFSLNILFESSFLFEKRVVDNKTNLLGFARISSLEHLVLFFLEVGCW